MAVGFSDEDVVRHPLVQKIIVAHEERDRESEAKRAAKAAAHAAAVGPAPADSAGNKLEGGQ